MARPVDLTPSLVLGAIRDSLLAEIMARPAPEPIVIRRDIAMMIASSISEQIDQVDALAEGAAAADRLSQELAIARADIRRLELKLEVRAATPRFDNFGPAPSNVVEALRRAAPIGATIIGLTEAFARERRGAGCTDGDGGAA